MRSCLLFGESGMLPDGFAGRVKNVKGVNPKFLISCDPVGLDDVFERFFAYYGEDDKDYSCLKSFPKNKL